MYINLDSTYERNMIFVFPIPADSDEHVSKGTEKKNHRKRVIECIPRGQKGYICGKKRTGVEGHWGQRTKQN